MAHEEKEDYIQKFTAIYTIEYDNNYDNGIHNYINDYFQVAGKRKYILKRNNLNCELKANYLKKRN